MRLLLRHGFSGDIFPVNPKYPEIAGLKCYPSLDAIDPDKAIDLAVIYLSADKVIDVVEACGRRGVRAVVVISSGFAEMGDEGRSLQAKLTKIANLHGMAMCGPNCAGIANFVQNFVSYGTTNFINLTEIIRGGVAIMSASGGFGNTIFTYCQERLLGVSHLIGLGNEAVTNSGDFLDVLADDPQVSLVLANLESIRDPAKFFLAADRAARNSKPVIVLKGGRSEVGREAIMTHTAALGGSPESFSGAFKQHGVIQVTDLDELADTAMLLSRCTPSSGNRVGVFSLPGGGTGLLSDNANDFGFVVPELSEGTVEQLRELLPPIATPRNPLDPTAGFGRDSRRLQTALKIFSSDPELDVILFFPLASEVSYAQKLADDLVAVKDEINKPVIVIWTAGRDLEPGAWRTLHQAGIPLFQAASGAFKAMSRAREYARFLDRRQSPDSKDFGAHASVSARIDTSIMGHTAFRSELERFGISFPRQELVTSAAAAADAVAQLGVSALKISSADIPHKTEAGCIRLDVRGKLAAKEAYGHIMDSAKRYAPDAALDGVLVQQMIGKGLELLLGIRTDDQLGPILTVGMGGVLAEILRDVSHRPVPICRSDARQMLAELEGAPLFSGFRGGPRYDVDAVIDAMLGLSAFANAVREFAPEIDLNPVVVLPENMGAIAVDLLAKFSEPKNHKGR